MVSNTYARDVQMFSEFVAGATIHKLGHRFDLPISSVGQAIKAVAKSRNPERVAEAIVADQLGAELIRLNADEFPELSEEVVEEGAQRLQALSGDLFVALLAMFKAAPDSLRASPAGREALWVLEQAKGNIPLRE